MVFTSFGCAGSVATSNTKIFESSRPPIQSMRRSSVKPPWCASCRPPTETDDTTFP